MDKKQKLSLTEKIHGIFCFLPFVGFISLFKIWPLIQVIIVSFKDNYNYLTKDYSGWGIENYLEVLSDEYFIQAVSNVLVYSIFVLLIANIVAIPTSWCLYSVKRFSTIFRIAIFLPFVTSNVAIGMAWRLIFSEKGVLNFFLSSLSLPTFKWLTDSSMSLITMIIYGVWSNIPFMVLLYYSFMVGIDRNLIVSASVDGAKEHKIFLKLVLPLMCPTIVMATMMTAINTWLEFDALFPLFSGKPGPYYDFYTIVYYIYSKVQQGNKTFGIACAASILLFICVLVFFVVKNVFQRDKEKDL